MVAEVTTKAGQKCTAIRRAIVPADLVQPVVDAVTSRITERVVVGDPRVEGVTMGALASMDQLRDVKAAVQRLIDGGGKVNGTLDAPTVKTADGDAVADGGAFMSPVILTWDDPDSEAVHSIEAFGPVTSVIGYSDLDDAVRLAAKGSGSLAATVCSNDPETVRRLVTGIAAHHGRVLTLNREDAKTSTGHGSPMPHLIHGGPGRAGGGEELGGVRAIKHHMQRTAIQGSPNTVSYTHLDVYKRQWQSRCSFPPASVSWAAAGWGSGSRTRSSPPAPRSWSSSATPRRPPRPRKAWRRRCCARSSEGPWTTSTWPWLSLIHI